MTAKRSEFGAAIQTIASIKMGDYIQVPFTILFEFILCIFVVWTDESLILGRIGIANFKPVKVEQSIPLTGRASLEYDK